MSKLVKAVIKADAGYFYRNRFITRRTYERVVRWLEGLDDLGDKESEVREIVSQWLESDADYLIELRPALLGFHWFLYPFMLLMTWAVPRKLRKYAAELRR